MDRVFARDRRAVESVELDVNYLVQFVFIIRYHYLNFSALNFGDWEPARKLNSSTFIRISQAPNNKSLHFSPG